MPRTPTPIARRIATWEVDVKQLRDGCGVFLDENLLVRVADDWRTYGSGADHLLSERFWPWTPPPI